MKILAPKGRNGIGFIFIACLCAYPWVNCSSEESDFVPSVRDQLEKNKRDLPKVQKTLIDMLKPVPIVDTIEEEEKYGNTGDKFNAVGRGFVNGVEVVTNLLNSALNFPVDAVKKVSRTATEALNNLGGKLVGLQRRRRR